MRGSTKPQSALLLLSVLLALPCAARADEPADDKARAVEFLKLAKQEAEAYTFRAEASGDVMKLQPEPILKWTNPVVGSIYGSVFLWTAQGRPEVVASIYKWYSPFRHRTNEFQSLSLGRLAAERDGRRVWTPSRPGVDLKPIPGAPAPASSPAVRLRQMRELAGDFSARQTDRNDVDRDMRLLAQPVYRYEGTQGDLIDGALFVFVLGTDPDAFLLIEDRQTADGARWQYAFARMNSIHIRANYRGHEAWSVPTLPWAQVGDKSEPYTTFMFDRGEAATP